ncbi:hypothetical protein [Rhizobium sp.]|uniref:hypothetical protein n=1 Tax=Rhizobium sp. TaxID=391 RepID=UPI00289CC401
MKIYENVVIGNFLYILGISDGSVHVPPWNPYRAVSLLQQTPLDKSIADVLLQSPGSLFIIEFKRIGASEKKEEDKKQSLRTVLSKSPELLALSEKIHWYVRSEVAEGQLQLEVTPYLSQVSNKRLDSLESLVATISERRTSRLDIAECAKYLDALRFAAAVSKGKGGDSSSSGTIVLLATDDGGFRHAVIDDLADLFTVHSKLIAAAATNLEDDDFDVADDDVDQEISNEPESVGPSFIPRYPK